MYVNILSLIEILMYGRMQEIMSFSSDNRKNVYTSAKQY